MLNQFQAEGIVMRAEKAEDRVKELEKEVAALKEQLAPRPRKVKMTAYRFVPLATEARVLDSGEWFVMEMYAYKQMGGVLRGHYIPYCREEYEVEVNDR